MTLLNRLAPIALGFGLLALGGCIHSEAGLFDVERQAADPELASEFDHEFPTVEQLRERLSLWPEQEAPLAAVLDDMRQHVEERRAARADGSAKLDRHAERRAFHERITQILDEEQRQEFHGAMKEVHQHLRGFDPAERRARHLDKLDELLELSDAQRARFAELLDEQGFAMKGMYQRGEKPSREAMQAHHEAMRAKLAEFLSEEQLAKLDAMRQERMAERHDKRGEHRHGNH